MSIRPRIFISAVTAEFSSTRRQVTNILMRLGYEPVVQDVFGTDSGDLRQILRDKIDSCEGLLQIVGSAYGAEPPTPDRDFGRGSYTQFEFLYAASQGKKTWLIVAEDGCHRDQPAKELDLPDDPNHPDPASYQAERRAFQRKYLDRLRDSGHLRHNAVDQKDLELKIERLRDEFSVLRRSFLRWQRAVIGAIVIVFCVLLLIGGGVWWSLVREPVFGPKPNAELLEELSDLNSQINALEKANVESLWPRELARLREQYQNGELMIENGHFADAESTIATALLQARQLTDARVALSALDTASRHIESMDLSSPINNRGDAFAQQVAAIKPLLLEAKFVEGVAAWRRIEPEWNNLFAEVTTLGSLEKELAAFDQDQLLSDAGDLWPDFQSRLAAARDALSRGDMARAQNEADLAKEMLHRITLPRMLHLSCVMGIRTQWSEWGGLQRALHRDSVSVDQYAELLQPVHDIPKHPLRPDDNLYRRMMAAAESLELTDLANGPVCEFIRDAAGEQGVACYEIGRGIERVAWASALEIDYHQYAMLFEGREALGQQVYRFDHNLENSNFQYTLDLANRISMPADILKKMKKLKDRLRQLPFNREFYQERDHSKIIDHATQLREELEAADLHVFHKLAMAFLQKEASSSRPN